MKVTRRENYRVEATPHAYHKGWQKDDVDHKAIVSDCGQLINEMIKHCEELGDARIEWDEREVCEYCGNEWENWVFESDNEDDIFYCCDKAKEDWEKSKVCLKCCLLTYRQDKVEEPEGHIIIRQPHRCEVCKEWYCSKCLPLNQIECEDCRTKREDEEHKKKFKGRRIVP